MTGVLKFTKLSRCADELSSCVGFCVDVLKNTFQASVFRCVLWGLVMFLTVSCDSGLNSLNVSEVAALHEGKFLKEYDFSLAIDDVGTYGVGNPVYKTQKSRETAYYKAMRHLREDYERYWSESEGGDSSQPYYLGEGLSGDSAGQGGVAHEVFYLRGVERNGQLLFELILNDREVYNDFYAGSRTPMPKDRGYLSYGDKVEYLYRLDRQGVVSIVEDQGRLRFFILREGVGCVRHKRFQDLRWGESEYGNVLDNAQDDAQLEHLDEDEVFRVVSSRLFDDYDSSFAMFEACDVGFEANDVRPKLDELSVWRVPLFRYKRRYLGTLNFLHEGYESSEPSCKSNITYLADIFLYDYSNDEMMGNTYVKARFTDVAYDSGVVYEVWDLGYMGCPRLEMLIGLED